VLGKLKVSSLGKQLCAGMNGDKFYLLERFGEEYQLNKVSACTKLQQLPETVDQQADFVLSAKAV